MSNAKLFDLLNVAHDIVIDGCVVDDIQFFEAKEGLPALARLNYCRGDQFRLFEDQAVQLVNGHCLATTAKSDEDVPPQELGLSFSVSRPVSITDLPEPLSLKFIEFPGATLKAGGDYIANVLAANLGHLSYQELDERKGNDQHLAARIGSGHDHLVNGLMQFGLYVGQQFDELLGKYVDWANYGGVFVYDWIEADVRNTGLASWLWHNIEDHDWGDIAGNWLVPDQLSTHELLFRWAEECGFELYIHGEGKEERDGQTVFADRWWSMSEGWVSDRSKATLYPLRVVASEELLRPEGQTGWVPAN